ncbi:hypothetical protein Ancab_036707, partial [Ancistrocladus abbreviatus]
MEQAHLYIADKVDEIRGPSKMKRKKAQEKTKGEWENSRPITGEIQNKKCNKKKQGQPSKKKSLKPSLIAVRRKRKKETEEDKANTSLRDKTTVEESSEGSSKLNEIISYGKIALNIHESKKDSRNVE